MAGPQGFWAAGRLGCCGEAGIRQGNRNGWAATVKNGAATVKRTARPAKSLRLRQTGSMASAPRLVTNRNKTSCRIKIGKALELEAAGCLQSPVQSLAGPTLHRLTACCVFDTVLPLWFVQACCSQFESQLANSTGL